MFSAFRPNIAKLSALYKRFSRPGLDIDLLTFLSPSGSTSD